MGNLKATIAEAPIKAGCRVLLRADYNVPVDEQGQITDDRRIVNSIPTLQYCLDRQAKLIICSHFGRPDGGRDARYSLRPVAERLQQLLPQVTVQFADDCVGDTVKQQINALPNGAILVLENVRFHAAETANDPAFAQQLADLADVYVNDAFGAAHRAHASTVGVAQYLPGYAGLLMAREIDYLSQVTTNPARPFTVIIGGKKIADKLPMVNKLADTADYILVGGLVAQQWQPDTKPHHAQILVAADQGADISPATVAAWQPILQQSKTIFWNGPLGKFEDPASAYGTQAIAKIVSESGALTVVGGGDTGAAIRDFIFDHVSTGGGAALEFVQGCTLPGVACLRNKGVKR